MLADEAVGCLGVALPRWFGESCGSVPCGRKATAAMAGARGHVAPTIINEPISSIPPAAVVLEDVVSSEREFVEVVGVTCYAGVAEGSPAFLTKHDRVTRVLSCDVPSSRQEDQSAQHAYHPPEHRSALSTLGSENMRSRQRGETDTTGDGDTSADLAAYITTKSGRQHGHAARDQRGIATADEAAKPERQRQPTAVVDRARGTDASAAQHQRPVTARRQQLLRLVVGGPRLGRQPDMAERVDRGDPVPPPDDIGDRGVQLAELCEHGARRRDTARASVFAVALGGGIYLPSQNALNHFLQGDRPGSRVGGGTWSRLGGRTPYRLLSLDRTAQNSLRRSLQGERPLSGVGGGTLPGTTRAFAQIFAG